MKRDTLEATFEPKRPYVVKGKLLNDLIKAIHRNAPLQGVGIKLSEQPDGILITATAEGGGSPVNCPFASTFEGETETMIRGGMVSGGEGNVAVASWAITTAGAPQDDGVRVWVKVEIDAVEEDDVLLPGCTVTSAVFGSGETMPDNELPTESSPSGTLYIDLGVWEDDEFIPSGCGNIQVSHCPGSLTYVRG